MQVLAASPARGKIRNNLRPCRRGYIPCARPHLLCSSIRMCATERVTVSWGCAVQRKLIGQSRNGGDLQLRVQMRRLSLAPEGRANAVVRVSPPNCRLLYPTSAVAWEQLSLGGTTPSR